jgi:hypothetical protein
VRFRAPLHFPNLFPGPTQGAQLSLLNLNVLSSQFLLSLLCCVPDAGLVMMRIGFSLWLSDL